MSIKAGKQDIIKKFQIHEKDAGSSQVQIALLTDRISCLTEHFKTHKKDVHSLYGLQALSNQRKKLLKYLERKNPEAYKMVVEQLKLRH